MVCLGPHGEFSLRPNTTLVILKGKYMKAFAFLIMYELCNKESASLRKGTLHCNLIIGKLGKLVHCILHDQLHGKGGAAAQ